ncbi:MAG: zinc dependent phospholipase C family protein [Clostridiales bacterium]|nr:zinc dependent phospholipase C family protein [Clostridiales bacterium]
MLSSTHRLIGASIISNLKENFNINIYEQHFLNGCVKPDYSIPLFFIPHYKEKSFDYIMQMVKDLTLFNFYQEKDLKLFYTNLGVITHFLCDYFCYAHNNKDLDPIFLHLKYEKQLHTVFQEISIDKFIISSMEKSISLEISSLFQLQHFIDTKHQVYKSTPHFIEKDIYYAIEIATISTYFIINYLLENLKYKVA